MNTWGDRIKLGNQVWQNQIHADKLEKVTSVCLTINCLTKEQRLLTILRCAPDVLWSGSLQEDMNLNEERKAPLRDKDLSTKREMVVQYISATAKSVSTHLKRELSLDAYAFQAWNLNFFV